MPSLSGLKLIIEKSKGNPLEIGNAVRRANEDHSALMRLFDVQRIEETTPEELHIDGECLFDDIYIGKVS